MNKLFFLLVFCIVIVLCQAQGSNKDDKKNTRSRQWQSRGGRQRWAGSKQKWSSKRKYSMKNYTNASWITVIDGIQVAESAKYRSGKDVIFMKSYDNILENSALDYKKSFFVYDVTKALGAIVVGHGQYCFITEMDSTATMDMVKEELRLLNNSESPIPKPLVEIYVSSGDAVSVESLLQKSFMISAICSRAANCDRAFMVTSAQQQQADVKTTWKTSGLYDRHAINLTFDPDEEMKECRTWHNYWRKNDKKT